MITYHIPTHGSFASKGFPSRCSESVCPPALRKLRTYDVFSYDPWRTPLDATALPMASSHHTLPTLAKFQLVWRRLCMMCCSPPASSTTPSRLRTITPLVAVYRNFKVHLKHLFYDSEWTLLKKVFHRSGIVLDPAKRRASLDASPGRASVSTLTPTLIQAKAFSSYPSAASPRVLDNCLLPTTPRVKITTWKGISVIPWMRLSCSMGQARLLCRLTIIELYTRSLKMCSRYYH